MPSSAAPSISRTSSPALPQPWPRTMPSSARCPRRAFTCMVLCLTRSCRIRCSWAIVCCSTVLTGTKRMLGRVTASQIASASAASCLLVLTYGLTYWGGISRTSCPSLISSRAQWWALPQASIPIRHGGRPAKNASSLPLASFLRSSGRPCASAPCTWNQDFARSSPTVVISITDGLPHGRGPHAWHGDAEGGDRPSHWFSEATDTVGDDEDARGGRESQDHAAEPVLPPVQSLVGQQPCAIVLDHAADPAQSRAVRRADLADMGLDAVPEAEGAVLGAVVARVGVRPADGGADALGQVQKMPEEARVVDVGGRGDGAQRQAVGRDDDMVLGPGLAAVGGVGAGQRSPPCLARTEQLSTTTSQGAASGPARTMRTRARWTRRSRATALQSSRRRRKVEPEARPTMARSSRHCTPSRRKNRSASTTLIVVTRGLPVADGRSSIRSMIPATNAVALDAMLASPCQRRGKRTLGLPDAERLTTNQSSGNHL